MTITEVSKLYEIPAVTLRYYEKIGLLPPVNRTINGIRDFKEDDRNWVYYIKVMREAGVSIESLLEYVKLFQQGASTIDERKQILIGQYNDIEERINILRTAQNKLKIKINGYEDKILKYEEEKLKKNENKKEENL